MLRCSGYNYPGSEWYEDSYALVTGDRHPRPARRKGGSAVTSGVFLILSAQSRPATLKIVNFRRTVG